MNSFENDLQNNISFALLEEKHIDAFAEIAKNAPDPWTRQNMQAALESPPYFCFTAFWQGVPAAFACFFSVDENVDLQLVATAPALRQKGIANALLRHAFAMLVKQGKMACLLEARLSNTAAIALYKQLGFKQLALRKQMYQKPIEDGILMCKDIRNL